MAHQHAARSKGFHKKGAKVFSIPGTKPSIQNHTLLVSSGIPSLDALIGGGIAVGSCLLIDEDKYNTYASLFLKYYLAEAVTSKHKILLASADKRPSLILQDLPQPITHMPSDPLPKAPGAEGDDLSIAWRYRNVAMADQAQSSFGHYYDITKVMSKEMISAANVTLFDPSSSNPQQPFTQLLNTVKQTLEEQQLCTSGPAIPTNILRVAISSLGSPYWSDDSRALPKFLFALRALLRRSYATCLITVPGHLLDDIGPLVRCSDSAIQLISFADNTEKYSKNPAFKEFHGLVNIKKLPCINSLVCHLPDTMDWVFKLKRKKLTIEKMHLPPDLSETVSRSQEDPVKAKSCGQTSSGVSIDF